jgi:hypothetical protein
MPEGVVGVIGASEVAEGISRAVEGVSEAAVVGTSEVAVVGVSEAVVVGVSVRMGAGVVVVVIYNPSSYQCIIFDLPLAQVIQRVMILEVIMDVV